MKREDLFLQSVAAYELPVVVRRERGGFFASCPTWSDCYAQGDTLEETLSEIQAVALSLIALYQEEGKPIPLRRRSSSDRLVKTRKFVVPLYVAQ